MLLKTAIAIATATSALAVTPGAFAHNAGHVVLPSGACMEIGSFKSVFPGPDKTTELDLIPATPLPHDEIGTSFAAFQGDTPILPGPCPS
ncbi:MAG: hypothetical protein ACJ744_07510 [Gaiellaceae bacterium]